MTRETLFAAASLGVLLPPSGVLGLLGSSVALGRPLRERTSAGLVASSFVVMLASALALDGLFLSAPERAVLVPLGEWFEVPGYRFSVDLSLDRVSLAMVTLTAAVCGLIGRFSRRYLHREPGYTRFFLLLSLFAAGMSMLALGGSFDLLFAGWEAVGFSSALLIGFFHERDEPARNALRAFITYRACDVGLLLGAILLHHHAGTSDILAPGSTALHGGWAVEATALLFLLAAAGKSALFPVGGWLPRAMEGPTPSSAIFYGALSIHAGAYLMLRASPLLSQAPLASAAVVALGALTALTATMIGRTQSDIKSSIAYATSTQVGLIFVEIGLGLTDLALVHLVSHACLRTAQLLRAPSALRDAERRAAAAAEPLPTGAHFERALPEGLRSRLYGLALGRFHLDGLLERFVVAPVLGLARAIASAERRYTGLIAGGGRRRSRASMVPSTRGGRP